MIATVLAACLGGAVEAQTVTYTMQTGNFNSLLQERNNNPPHSGSFNNGPTEVGQYANGGGLSNTPGAAAFQTFTTNGNGTTGSTRALQVGDAFTITGYIGANPSAGGYVGISFRDSTTYTNFFSSTDSATEARFQLDSSGNWKVYNAGSAVESADGAAADRTFTITVTSGSTFNAAIGSTTYYNLGMAASGGSIDSFAIYTFGDNNQNSYWKNGSLVATGTVQLGYALASGNFTPGTITDGLNTDSTSTVKANTVFVGGDAGSQVNLAQNNTYTGVTTINANATGEAQHANALGSTSAGTTVSNAGTLKLYSPTGITYAAEALTLNGLGVSGVNGALRQVGGNNTWTGNVTLASSSRINADTSGGAGSLTISGNVSGGSNVLFVGANGAPITISGTLSGAGAAQDGTTTSVFKDGANTLTFSANNTYTGDTRITSGTLTVASGGNLGNGSDVFLSTGAVLNLATSVTVNSLQETAINNAGTVIIGSGAVLTINGSGFNVFQDSISGSGGLSIAGSGTTNLFDPQTYTGTTSVSAGRLSTSGSMSTSAVDVSGGTFATTVGNLLPDVVPVLLSGAGVFSIGGNETIGSLSGSGGTAALGASNLTLAGNDSKTFAGAFTGSGTFAKNGSGDLTLSGNSGSFTGVMSVLGGSLLVTGSHAMNQLSVASGASLGGSGDIGYAAATALTFAAGATLSPGNSVGALDGNFDNATLSGGMTYLFEVNDANGTAGGPNGWDIFTNAGDVTLAADGTNRIDLDIASLNGSISGTAANFNPNFNYAWKFVVAGTPISQFSSSWFNVDTTGFANSTSGGSFYVARGDQMSNIGASGTDKELYVVFAAVPEPSSFALVGCGLASLAVLRWNRSRRLR